MKHSYSSTTKKEIIQFKDGQRIGIDIPQKKEKIQVWLIRLSSQWSVVKNTPANAGYMSFLPGLGRSRGRGNGNPLQDSCLGNPMDRGASGATVHEVAKSQTQLSTRTHMANKHETRCTILLAIRNAS